MTTQTSLKTFNAAIEAFNARTARPDWADLGVVNAGLTGHGADWGVAPAPIFSNVAAMNAAVDEAIAEDDVLERAKLWSSVAAIEACYRDGDCKIDGREG